MQLGQNIKGYILTQWLGSGGMGEVYQAQHQTSRRLAAVKVLYRTDQAARFKNEAYIQASVQHPHIAALYEYTIENGTPCIIMEYVEGITLEKLIKRQGRLPESFVWKIMEQIVLAVVHLHEKNIIHRDLKPGNVKVNRESVAKLLDFGIAKSAYTPKLTQEGYIVGTSHYMAPEQFQNKVGIESDCWALGVLFYEMLTGYLPFDGRSETEVRLKIEKGNYTAPDLLVPEVSKRSKRLIQRLLKANASSRMNANELLTALQNPDNNSLFSITEWVNNITDFVDKMPVKRWLRVNND
ncbi:serine/threonine-protein kinase [Runella sp. MFBS21]|uniref:serine/threonine-protein kinase n=1 Tax=Runella sp. MFBS21 TaxID=3034018 RepID=UPI0023F6DB75|nr:serine/threonine-protein kinase [Runella sp. MFBS21]MDF7821720.1 serine/threonine-protein kinase [Runella sp. MFBS21]